MVEKCCHFSLWTIYTSHWRRRLVECEDKHCGGNDSNCCKNFLLSRVNVFCLFFALSSLSFSKTPSATLPHNNGENSSWSFFFLSPSFNRFFRRHWERGVEEWRGCEENIRFFFCLWKRCGSNTDGLKWVSVATGWIFFWQNFISFSWFSATRSYMRAENEWMILVFYLLCNRD